MGIKSSESEISESTCRFISALRDHDAVLARDLIEQGPLNVNFIGADKVSPLMIAAYRGYADICERLIGLGADVQYGFYVYYPGEDGMDERIYDSVVERAMVSRHAKTIDVIERAFTAAQWLSVKASTTEQKDDLFLFGVARLLDAARLGMIELVADMVRAGVPVEDPDFYPKMSPLITAAHHGQLSTCVVLVALGANPADLRRHPAVPVELQKALETIAFELFGSDALNRPQEWQDERGVQI